MCSRRVQTCGRPIRPNLEIPKYSTSLPANPTPANLVDSLSSPMTRDFTGTVMSWVYRNPGTGFLTFVYQLTNTDTKDLTAARTMDGWSAVNILVPAQMPAATPERATLARMDGRRSPFFPVPQT